jgi:hypothetical protein
MLQYCAEGLFRPVSIIAYERSLQMAEPTKPSDPLVFVKDKEGNEFICHMSQLKDPKKASKEELEQCVDSGAAAYDPGN